MFILNAYSTLRQLPEINFPFTQKNQRDHDDPELADHLEGFAGYVLSRNPGQMSQMKYHVWRHIQRVNNQVSVTVDEKHMGNFAKWAWEANAIVFTPDGDIRDPNGAILIQANGSEPDPEARVPYPLDAQMRKEQNSLFLEKKQIQAPLSLPPVIGEGEVVLREAEEVARRMLCLFTVAVRAESLASGEPLSEKQLKNKFEIIWDEFSPAEATFIHDLEPKHQQVVNFAWRYEAVAVLQWALRSMNDLPFPDAICNVPLTGKLAMANNTMEFLAAAQLRPTSEILDALDLHVRLHWAAREARLQKDENPPKIDEGVIRERHQALNWLVRFENSDWDDVDTPT